MESYSETYIINIKLHSRLFVRLYEIMDDYHEKGIEEFIIKSPDNKKMCELSDIIDVMTTFQKGEKIVLYAKGDDKKILSESVESIGDRLQNPEKYFSEDMI